MKCLIILFLLFICGFSETINVDKEDFLYLVNTSKTYAYKTMLYEDLLSPFELHFYKISTSKLELETGTLLQFNISLFQKPSEMNNMRNPLVFSLDFEYEDNYAKIEEKYDKKKNRVETIKKVFSYIGIGLGSLTTGIVIGIVAF